MPRKKGSRNSKKKPEVIKEPEESETMEEIINNLDFDGDNDEIPEIEIVESKKEPFQAFLEAMSVSKDSKKNYDLKDLAKMFENSLKTLVNTQDSELHRNTDLDSNNIPSLAVMDSVGEFYHLRSVGLFLNRFYRMRISKERKSRDEILQAVKILNQVLSMDIIANSNNPALTGQMFGFTGYNNPAMVGNEQIMKPKSRWKFWQR